MNQYKDVSDLHIDQCTWSSLVGMRSGMGVFWLWEGVHLQNTTNTHIIAHWLGFIGYFYSTTLQISGNIGVHMVLHCTKKGNFMNKYMSKTLIGILAKNTLYTVFYLPMAAKPDWADDLHECTMVKSMFLHILKLDCYVEILTNYTENNRKNTVFQGWSSMGGSSLSHY